MDAAIERFGQIDICVIGPGAGWHPEPVHKLNADMALEDAEHELAPIYHLLPLVLPGMYERQWGRVVGLALHPTKLPPAFAYNAAKAARTHALLLAHQAAWEHGVTVNVIAPGPVAAVEGLEEAVAQCDNESAWRDRTDVSPQDIGEAVAFLCSEAGSYVTGCVVPFGFR